MRLPRFTATTRPASEPRRPIGNIGRVGNIGSLVRTGKPEVWSGVRQIGKAIGDVGDKAFAIANERMEIDRDLKTTKFGTDLENRDGTQYDTYTEQANPKDEYEKADSLSVMDKSRTDWINEYLKNEKSSVVRARMKLIAESSLKEFTKNINSLANAKLHANQVETVNTMAKDMTSKGNVEGALALYDSISGVGEGARTLLTPQQARKLKETYVYGESINQSIENAASSLDPEAIKKTNELIDNSPILTEDKMQYKQRLKTKVAQKKVEQNKALEILQKETARQMLGTLWDGDLQEEDIRTALDGNALTYERAKDLRTALMHPNEFNLPSYIQVKNAVRDYGSGKIEFDDALDTLIANARGLGDEGKGLTDKLFGEQNKNETDWEQEAIDYIDSQILEKDLFTGLFYGTPVQQTRALEARLAYDKALEQAEREGNPVMGRDKLILAHNIMLKYRPTEEEKQKTVPPEALEKGLGAIPVVSRKDIQKAIKQAKTNLGESASPQDIKEETLRILGQ